MKKNHFIYSIIYFSFFILINCGISSEGKEGSTSSIKNSKEKNLWQASYFPNNNIIELEQDTFIIREIWVEKRWLYRHNEMHETFKEKFGKDMYNIYLSFDKDAFSAFLKDGNNTPFESSLSDNKVINGISGTKLMGHLEKPFPDTLSFKYNVTKFKQDSILLFKKK